MKTKFTYLIGLLFLFGTLVSIYIVMRFILEEKTYTNHHYISNQSEYVLEIAPELFFQDGVLQPLFDTKLTEIERSFFSMREELKQFKPNGINLLAPIYLSFEKIDTSELVIAYLSLTSEKDFTQFSQDISNSYPNISTSSKNNVGIITYSNQFKQAVLTDKINLLFKQTGTLSPTLFEKDTAHWLTLHSIHNNKIQHRVKVQKNELTNIFTTKGTLNGHLTPINTHIQPDSLGIYYAISLTDSFVKNKLKNLLPQISTELMESINGIEINYLGIHLDGNKPIPNVNIHLHTDNPNLLKELLIEQNVLKPVESTEKNEQYLFLNEYILKSNSTNEYLTLHNTPYKTIDTPEKVVFRAKGKPMNYMKIDNQLGQLFINLNNSLRVTKNFLNSMHHFECSIYSTNNNLVIDQKVEFKEGSNGIFELLFWLKNVR
jgi:hypothetical protein